MGYFAESCTKKWHDSRDTLLLSSLVSTLFSPFCSYIVEGLGDLRRRELSSLLVKPLQEALLVYRAVADAVEVAIVVPWHAG